MRGFECTIGVEDVRAIAALVPQHGGKLTLEPLELEGVGTLIRIKDTEGNTFGAMQYTESVRD